MSSNGSQQKISAFVIAYNRRDIVRTCLKGLAFADELILVDKSSTDGTVDAVKDLVDHIHIVPWSPTVEETRAYAASLCSHEWIVFLDDDECLNEAAIEYFLKELESSKEDIYFLPRKEYIMGQHDSDAYYWPEHHLRCFRRGAVEFLPTVHAGIKLISNKIVKTPVETGVAIEHFSHESVHQWIEKTNRYTSRVDRLRQIDHSDDVLAFAHASIDRWVARSRNTAPGSYAASAALLRASYDIIDRLKSWEEERGIDGAAIFARRCAVLEQDYGANPLLRPRFAPAETHGAPITQAAPDVTNVKANPSETEKGTFVGSLENLTKTNFALAAILKSLREESALAIQAVRKEAAQTIESERTNSTESISQLKRIVVDEKRRLDERIAQLDVERAELLQQLGMAYRRPWRRFKNYTAYCVLKAAAFASTPFSPRAAERFKRSAQKRGPRRFEKMPARSQDAEPSAPPPAAKIHAQPKRLARRILVADYRVPRPDVSAGEQATVGLLRDLCALGYEVTFIPNDMNESPGYDDRLREMGITLVNRASGYRSSSDYIAREGQNFGVYYLIRIDVAEDILPMARMVASDARVIFHAPDLYFLRETREAAIKNDPAARVKAEATRRREVSIMGAADHVILVSGAELPFLRAELPDKPISVFPALYAEVKDEPNGFAARSDIFFLGGFAHTPNVDAVAWFADHVWPLVLASLPDVRFKIVGAEMPPSVINLGQRPGIEIVGFVPKLDPILNGSRLGVAPLLYGAGIKGKVAASMGAGVPNVCTTIAAEGMGIVDGVHALVADNPRAFADAIVSLYTDEKLWRRISANGRALVQEKFGDAANRASFLSALNDARALPIPLLIEHCNKSAPISFPVYDPAIVPDVSIVVPVYNKWGLTRACLNSIALTCADSDARYEVILADDGSTDETTKAATIFPSLRVVKTPSNLGFLRNCNNAATHARGRYILLLNNDTIVLPGWLKTLYQAMEADPEIAIAGSKLLYPDGKVQEAGGALFQDGSAINVGRGLERDAPAVGIARTVDYISGASILIRSDFWKLVGGFDERYKNAYCEDSDLAMSARAHGMVVRYEPASEVIHFEHQSYVDETSPQNLARTLQKDNTAILHEKWGEVFRQDHVPPHEYKRAAGDAARPIPPSAPARKSGTTSSNSARSPSPFK